VLRHGVLLKKKNEWNLVIETIGDVGNDWLVIGCCKYGYIGCMNTLWKAVQILICDKIAKDIDEIATIFLRDLAL
jgi:hypothetical protein